MSVAASPSRPVQRTLMHTRQVVVQVFERSDGLFDVEASLQDTKTFDMPLATGVSLSYDGDLKAIRFIEQLASATLNVSYYA
jgi:hypothetical protein